MTTERAGLRAPYSVRRIEEAKDDWWDVLDAEGENIALTGGPEALLIRDALNALAAPVAVDVERLREAFRHIGRQYKPSGLYDALMEKAADAAIEQFAAIAALLEPVPPEEP